MIITKRRAEELIRKGKARLVTEVGECGVTKDGKPYKMVIRYDIQRTDFIKEEQSDAM